MVGWWKATCFSVIWSLVCVWHGILPCGLVSRQSAPWPLPSSIDSFPFFRLLTDVCLSATYINNAVFFLSFFLKPSSKWKTSWSSVWRADTVLLASPQKCTSISFFFLSVSCVLERTECGSSTPFPTLNNRHTQSFCLTQLFLFCCLSPAGLRD